jgi:hypothetical protein
VRRRLLKEKEEVKRMRGSWLRIGIPALVVIALLVGSVFAGAEKSKSNPVVMAKEATGESIQNNTMVSIPQDIIVLRAKEDREIEHQKDSYEYRKIWEKEAKRKLFHHEEKVDREYEQILETLREKGILAEFFREREIVIRTTGKRIDKVEFAREFLKRKGLSSNTGTEQTFSTVSTLSAATSCTDMGAGNPNRYERDRIYYDPWGEEAYVDVRDRLRFYLTDATYIGLGEWVHLYNGDVIDFTWRGYYDPESEVNWILQYLEDNYGITSDEVELIHMKYFINADVYDMKHLDDNEWVWLGDKRVELWSEANYYPNNPPGERWENYGYPDEYQGGVNIIESNGYTETSAGFSYHNPYPECTYRHFGIGSETGIELTIYSNPWHQQAIVR